MNAETELVDVRPRWTFRWTSTRRVLAVVAIVGGAFAVLRLLYGLGAATNLSDRWPWGLWVWWDVLTGVALAGGGYSTALLVHFLGRHRWKPVERAAFLTSLIGYLLVCAGLFLDLGRWTNVWQIPFVWRLNPHSVMFELMWCVLGYTVVQIVEFGYIFIERARAPRLAKILSRIYAPVLIVGITLPLLHQSALGSLYLLAAGRLDPLWWSMLLPLFFLVSSFFVGPAMVTVESFLSARAHGRRPPVEILAEMVRLSGFLMLAYLCVKVVDLAWRGVLTRAVDGSTVSTLFLAEIGLGVLVPALLFLRPGLVHRPARLVTAAGLTVLGVALGRANVVFTGMAASAGGASYLPSLAEVGVTAGLVAAGVLAYLFVVENFPILPPAEPLVPAAGARRPAAAPIPVRQGELVGTR
jgi:Ni/Fe-hydrogenase subunit HybB-like protein